MISFAVEFVFHFRPNFWRFLDLLHVCCPCDRHNYYWRHKHDAGDYGYYFEVCRDCHFKDLYAIDQNCCLRLLQYTPKTGCVACFIIKQRFILPSNTVLKDIAHIDEIGDIGHMDDIEDTGVLLASYSRGTQ